VVCLGILSIHIELGSRPPFSTSHEAKISAILSSEVSGLLQQPSSRRAHTYHTGTSLLFHTRDTPHPSCNPCKCIEPRKFRVVHEASIQRRHGHNSTTMVRMPHSLQARVCNPFFGSFFSSQENPPCPTSLETSLRPKRTDIVALSIPPGKRPSSLASAASP